MEVISLTIPLHSLGTIICKSQLQKYINTITHCRNNNWQCSVGRVLISRTLAFEPIGG